MTTKLIIFDLDDTLYDLAGIQKDYHLETLEKIVPFPGVKEFLADFSGKKVLVTKESGHDQQKKIDLLGIRDFFEIIFICLADEEKKNCFQQVMAKYPHTEIWVIGDRIDSEIRYGKELGLKTVLIKRGKYQNLQPLDKFSIPDHEISQFSELKNLLNSNLSEKCLSEKSDSSEKLKAVILAAGKGTRFASEEAKVLQKISGRPMVVHVVNLAAAAGVLNPIVIIGYQGEKVKEALQSMEKIKEMAAINFAWQKEQLGTGHAVMMAVPYLQDFSGDVLILYGDVPSLKKETLQKLICEHQRRKSTLTILTAVLADPKWYGRVLKDERGLVTAIREAKDATDEELKVKEINSGILLINNDFLLSALKQLKNSNKQKEYYLTDIVEIAVSEERKVSTVVVEDESEIKGVNTFEELKEMENIFLERDSKENSSAEF